MKKKEYIWLKKTGHEQWDLFGTAQKVFGLVNVKVGSIYYDFKLGEYTFHKAWNILYPNGITQHTITIIADKLKTINKEMLIQ